MVQGGIPDKLDHRYEAKWLVRQLLDVVAGKADWLRFEGIMPQFEGFEFALRRGRVTEWHQTKINAPHGNWTVNALKREHVLAAFKNRLGANVDDRCLFISQDPAKDLRTLTEKAEIANDYSEFAQALAREQQDKFDQLKEGWGVDALIAYAWLRRCEFRTLPEAELDEITASHSALYFSTLDVSAFSILRTYAENRFNKELTTELVRAEIREAKAGGLTLKDWSLDPTLRERLDSETDAYLQTYSPFGAGGSTIPRWQSCELADRVTNPDGPNVILLTGIAGSGKSCVIRGLIDKLREWEVMHFALRIDHHLNRSNPQEIGQALTGREESPVTTLKGLEPDHLSVFIIDQVDAVSEVSGRSGAVKDAVLRMVNDARYYGTVRMVLVCRSFDLDSDPRFKELQAANSVERIEVPLLVWDDEVAPFLTDKGIDTNVLSPVQKELLCLPLHLAVFLEVSSEESGFVSRNDLFARLIEKKDRAIRQDRSLTWSIMKPLTVLAGWMSDHQSLNAPQAVFDEFPGAQDLLISEGLIIQSRGHVHFFHESFFDYLYARAFVVGTQSLVGLLTSNNTEQHLFRRTQTRQILETLRQNDPGRYLRELASVLKSDAIRYHIKAAVAQWLGALSDPTEQERDIVLQLDDDNAAYLPLVRYALMASVGWFDRLYKGGWVRSVLHGANDERRRSVLRWLSNIARERPTEVADLLESWWEHDPERGIHLLDWFGSVGRQNQDQRLIALCEKVIRSRPLGLLEDNGQRRREMFLATWTETNSEEGVGILQALFDTWFDAHPGHHPFERDALHDQDLYTLGQVAEKTPRAFIMGTIDALIRSIDEIKRREAAGERDYSFEHRTFSGHRFGADKFLGFFRSALQQAASDAPDAADEFLSRLDVSKHEVLLHLHLEVVSANGEAFAGHLLELLDNTYLFQAGWDGADW